MKAFETVAHDAVAFQSDLRLAGNAWRNADGKADTFARSALAALVSDAMSPMVIAVTVYDEMAPKTAKGKLAEPKESEKAAGGVSVSTLRSAKGGEGARSALEAIFYIADHAALDVDAVGAFIRNDKVAMRLFPLKAHLAKLKLEAAKAEAEAAKGAAVAEGGDVEPKADEEGTPVPAVVGDVAAMAKRIEGLSGEELDAAAEAIATLLAACRDACDRLAAAEQLKLAA